MQCKKKPTYLLALFIGTSFACQDSPKRVFEDKTMEKPASSAQIKDESKDTSGSATTSVTKPPVPVRIPVPSSEGHEFDDKWIVILGALDKRGMPPKDWERTRAKLSAQGSKPVTTWSNYFKGLMPCWNIIIGGSFDTKKQASAYTKKLKKAGINNYFKHAGKYVGNDPQVEQACEQIVQATSQAVPFFPIIQWGGHVLVPVIAPKPVLDRAMEKAKPIKPVDESTHAWLQDLVPIRIGEMSIGKPVSVYPRYSSSSKTCKIKRFVSLTWGQPHFSWKPDGIHGDGPSCGYQQVMAQLDCELGGEGDFSLGAFEGTKLRLFPMKDGFDVTETQTQLKESQKQLLLHPSVVAQKKKAQSHANEYEQSVKLLMKESVLSSKNHVLQHVTYFTGEGFTSCGGEDFFQRQSIVLRDGKPISKFVDSDYSHYRAGIQYQGKDYFLVEGSYGTISLQDADGKSLGGIVKSYCDCEC